MKNQKIETYQIRVNKILSDNERVVPYSKYIKNDYPQLTKVVPKNSILYKAKFRPEIVINEFHQTSNNFNTNINIKTNEKLNSNTNFKTKSNNAATDICQNSDYINNNNNRNFYTEKSFRNSKYLSRINLSENIINKRKEDKSNTETSSPFSKGNNKLGFDYQNKTNNNENNFNKGENKLTDYIFQSPLNNKIKKIMPINIDKSNLNNNNYNDNNDNNLYSTYSFKKLGVGIKKNDNEGITRNTFNSFKYKKIIKQKNLSMGGMDFYDKANTEGHESNLESILNKGYNNFIFFSGNKIKKFNDKSKNIKESAILKMEIYRVKLFQEFFKHFQNFIKNLIKNNFDFFINKLKDYKKNKYFFIKHKKTNSYILNNDNKEINIIDTFKSSTTKDYYKIYNELKKYQKINSNLKNIFNSNNLFNNINKRNSSLSLTLKNKNYIKSSSPRNNLSLKKERNRKEQISESPSLHIGNRTIINRDISFGSNGKENELYRDSKELNKKYEQIQRRRKKLKLFNKSIGLKNNKSEKNIEFKSKNNDSVEFNEMKKYIQSIKKNNSLYGTRNSINNGRHKYIKINTIEDNNNNNNEKKDENKDNNNKDNNKDINNIIVDKINNNKQIKENKTLFSNYEKRIANSAKNSENNRIIYNYKDSNRYSFKNKNNIYYSKKINKVNKLFSIVIKDISTKDNLIHINIKYYFLKRIKKPLNKTYSNLSQANTFSINLFNEKKKKKNDFNLKIKLTSIQEEDVSVQNSKIYEDSDNASNNKKLLQFIDKIYDIMLKKYKKNLLYKIKIIELVYKMNNIFNNKNNTQENSIDENDGNIENEYNNKSKDNINITKTKIYNKKRGYKVNKIRNYKNNYKNKIKEYEDKINNFRYNIIKYSIRYYNNK